MYVPLAGIKRSIRQENLVLKKNALNARRYGARMVYLLMNKPFRSWMKFQKNNLILGFFIC